MPSSAARPTIAAFRRAFSNAILGQRDELANVRTGGGYDRIGGPGAILWSRQVAHDQWLLRQCFDTTAEGDALEARVERRYGVPRIKATYGPGTATLQRATPGQPGGTIYQGTRVEVVRRGSGDLPEVFAVATDTPVLFGALSATVPIRATRLGRGVATSVSTPASLRLADSVFDPELTVVALQCADGTDEERAEAFIARAKAAQLAARPGYMRSVEAACRAAGAADVVALAAGTFGDDLDPGLSYAYVADAGGSAPEALLKACVLALDAARIAGCDVQVAPMVPTPVSLTVGVRLVDTPAKFNLTALRSATVAALVDEFKTRRRSYLFRLDSLAGAAQRVSPVVQSVAVTSTPAEPTAGFPTALPRYSLAPGAVSVAFMGPS